MPGNQSIEELLNLAASEVVPAPEREPWQYGWCLKEYRRSEDAALDGADGPVSLTQDGIEAFESAVSKLLRENQVRERWDPEELWGVVASLIVVASEEEAGERSAFIKESLEKLQKCGRALTIQLISNVTWGRPPLIFGNGIVGDANVDFIDFVNAAARGRACIGTEQAESWLNDQVRPRITGEDAEQPVAIACWTTGQLRLALVETERQLNDIIDLAILLENDLTGHEIYRRGDVNRPGIRGITVDRGAIERALHDTPAAMELISLPVTASVLKNGISAQWYSAEPLPLGDLFNQAYLRDAVQSCFKTDPISNRMRVAARWFAEAHYTSADDDAALALGVAMDALLNGQRALPGNAMADRLALLSDDSSKRRQLVRDYLDAYGVRSSVAHGGRSSKLNDPEFLKKYQELVHWTAWRSLALRDKFKVSTDKGIDDLYDELRWGVQSW